jgi:integrase/recombinase XerD
VELFLLDRQIEARSTLTLSSYRQRLGKFLDFIGDECPDIDAVNKDCIGQFLLHLQKSKYSPAYIHGHFKELRNFFNWCVAEGYIAKSPMHNLKAPKVPKVKRALLNEAQRDRLLALCPHNTLLGARNAAMIWILWSTGMRRDELATLKVDDIVWGDKGRVKVWGKGGKERWVPFTRSAQKSMLRYIHHRRGLDYTELWLTEERCPAKKSTMITAMRRLFDRAGLREECGKGELNHIFRRSWAVRNLKKGKSLKDIQLIGGWESMATLEIYLRAMDTDDALERDWE